MSEITNPTKGIIGKRVDNARWCEADHFYQCIACGQMVDMRDFGQVFNHEEDGHKPHDLKA